jgi:hypothetical protein
MSKLKDEAFRDTIGTIDQEGKENLFFLKNLQASSMTVGLAIFTNLIANLLSRLMQPFMLFNILERRFNIFGFPFAARFTFCFVYDRRRGLVIFYCNFWTYFCGWICPQTIFLEMVF